MQHGIDTKRACLTEHDWKTKPTLGFNKLQFIKPDGVWLVNLVSYLQNVLYQGFTMFIFIDYIFTYLSSIVLLYVTSISGFPRDQRVYPRRGGPRFGSSAQLLLFTGCTLRKLFAYRDRS